MNNPLKQLIDNQPLACYRVADKAGLTRGALYKLYNQGELPNAELDTLRRVAAVLGQRVVITFEQINDSIQS